MRPASIGVLPFSLWSQITSCEGKECPCGYNKNLYPRVLHPEMNHPEGGLMETRGFRAVAKAETVLTIYMNMVNYLAQCQEDEDLQVDDDGDQDDTAKNSLVETYDFQKEREQKNIVVQDAKRKFLNLNRAGNKACLKRRQENITIYYYESDEVNGTFKGMPIALNFTDTDKFLKCSRTGSDVRLSVMACRKDDLRFISKNNRELLPFVFYMRGDPGKGHILESASCEGWFVHAALTSVDATDQTQEKDSLNFFIHTMSAPV